MAGEKATEKRTSGIVVNNVEDLNGYLEKLYQQNQQMQLSKKTLYSVFGMFSKTEAAPLREIEFKLGDSQTAILINTKDFAIWIANFVITRAPNPVAVRTVTAFLEKHNLDVNRLHNFFKERELHSLVQQTLSGGPEFSEGKNVFDELKSAMKGPASVDVGNRASLKSGGR